MSRPIEQAAAGTTFYERAQIHHTTAEFRLGDPLLFGRNIVPYTACDVTLALRAFDLHDVVLDADRALLFQDGEVIGESLYFVTPEEVSALDPNRIVRLPANEDFVIGYNRPHGGYQHWMTQCLPAIDQALRRTRSRPVRLVLPRLADWQEQTLDLLGYRHVPRLTVQPGQFYHLPHAEYAEYLHGKHAFAVCRSAYQTMRRLLERLPDRGEKRPILFVPCSNPYYGTIANEPEIIAFFERTGAGIIDDRLSLTERLNLFRKAEVVIGPLGQGLTDILFCRPGTLLWEWMPRHHQNTSLNRLAQAAQADYWGDVFESDPAAGMPQSWSVPLERIRPRLAEISERLAQRAVAPRAPARPVASPTPSTPLDEVMLAFQSLGDNCEFGLVQRRAGAEPLGLLRFAGLPLERLIRALDTRFEGVGQIEHVDVIRVGSPRAELMVHETSLDTRYHTFIFDDEVEPDELRRRQAKQLTFLRRKMLEDLESGEKIWVWREWEKTDPERLQPLLERLRRLGPNRLLWVTAVDEANEAGTTEQLAPDFIRGYVRHLAPYHAAGDFHARSWFEVCERAYRCWMPQVEAEPESASQTAQVPLSAMDRLRLNPAVPDPTHLPTTPPRHRHWFFKLLDWK